MPGMRIDEGLALRFSLGAPPTRRGEESPLFVDLSLMGTASSGDKIDVTSHVVPIVFPIVLHAPTSM